MFAASSWLRSSSKLLANPAVAFVNAQEARKLDRAILRRGEANPESHIDQPRRSNRRRQRAHEVLLVEDVLGAGEHVEVAHHGAGRGQVDKGVPGQTGI